MRKIGCRSRCGFSLAEAMIATVVLAIAAAGLLLPFTSGLAVRAEGQHRTLGAKLAADLMERIVNTPFDQLADKIAASDDWVYTDSESQGQVTDADENVFTDPAYTNFSRDVSCEYMVMPQEAGTTDAGFILATVRVCYKGREVAVINRLISQ